jgi:hypothetical protein
MKLNTIKPLNFNNLESREKYRGLDIIEAPLANLLFVRKINQETNFQ